MRTKMYRVLGVLILIICITTVLLLYNTDTELIPLFKGDTQQTKKVIEEENSMEDRDIPSPPVPSEATIEKTTSQSDVTTTKTKTEYATEPLGYHKEGVEGMYVTHIPRDPDRFAHLPEPPLPPSAVPEDCPEHLKLKPELIDGVYRGFEPPPVNDQFDQLMADYADLMRNNVFEIVREYNPKRPYAEIWDQYIEYEKMYRAYAEWELGYTPSASISAGRIDWQYEQIWAFPEFTEWLMLEEQPDGEEDRFRVAVDVAMGYINQDWNKFTLKDGRDFFIKGDTRYEFKYLGVTEDGNKWTNTTCFSQTRVTESTPVVVIDVYNTSDEELEALMGWDYTINPLTLRPLAHDSSFVTIHPRMMGEE